VMKGDRERCLATGMDGYLSKPIRPVELDEVLDHYLANSGNPPSTHDSAESTAASVCAAELLERIDGDRAFLSELVDLFRADYPGQIQAAREAVANNDPASLQKVGHALKGALGNLAATRAARIASELESTARDGDMARAAERVTDLEKELVVVIEALEGLCLEAV